MRTPTFGGVPCAATGWLPAMPDPKLQGLPAGTDAQRDARQRAGRGVPRTCASGHSGKIVAGTWGNNRRRGGRRSFPASGTCAGGGLGPICPRTRSCAATEAGRPPETNAPLHLSTSAPLHLCASAPLRLCLSRSLVPDAPSSADAASVHSYEHMRAAKVVRVRH